MPITRTLWKNPFSSHKIPSYPCPVCETGVLIGKKSDFHVFESTFSKKAHDSEGWDPGWIFGHYSGIFRCQNVDCRESVVTSGRMDMVGDADYDEDFQGYNFSYNEELNPKLFIPALHIFRIHKDVPSYIQDMIRQCFSLYWIDESSCANKIRVAVELIMDDQKIAKTYVDKKKRRGYSLHKRIEMFQIVQADQAELLMAIKWIGNTGSHSDAALTKDDILDALEILDHVTTKLYEQDSLKIKKLSKAINKRKKPNSSKRLKEKKPFGQ